MNSSILLISGLAWLAVGFIIGNFAAIQRMIHSPELDEKLEDLRKIRYEADRAKTIFSLAKMFERVNKDLLGDLMEQLNRDLEQAKKYANKD